MSIEDHSQHLIEDPKLNVARRLFNTVNGDPFPISLSRLIESRKTGLEDHELIKLREYLVKDDAKAKARIALCAFGTTVGLGASFSADKNANMRKIEFESKALSKDRKAELLLDQSFDEALLVTGETLSVVAVVLMTVVALSKCLTPMVMKQIDKVRAEIL